MREKYQRDLMLSDLCDKVIFCDDNMHHFAGLSVLYAFISEPDEVDPFKELLSSSLATIPKVKKALSRYQKTDLKKDSVLSIPLWD